jgi:hypothetical protein
VLARAWTLQQVRAFAAPIKMTNSKFLKKEITENPEFFKAFPHLVNPEYSEETQKLVEKRANTEYFQSLGNQHPNYMPNLDEEQMMRDNELNFTQAASAHVHGPRKYLTQE